MDFIQAYWQQAVFTGIMFLFGLGYRQLVKKVKKYEYLGDGVKALLYDRLRQSYNYHMKNGFISIDEYKYFHKMYDSHHKIGGNGAGDEMLSRLKELPPCPISSPK